jgi:hypothetical protein
MSLPSRLLGANPSIQVSALLSGSLSTPSAKQAFVLPEDFEVISSYTVSGSSTTTITFSSIPQTYKNLFISAITRGSDNSPSGAPNVRMNGYSGASDYMSYYLVTQDQNNQAAVAHGGNASYMFFPVHQVSSGSMVQSDYFSPSRIYIPDYTNTSTFKNIFSQTGFWNTSGSGTESQTRFNVSTMKKTDAVTEISFSVGSPIYFVAKSRITLYGIK